MSEYANRKRLKGPTLKEGDSVYLIHRNIKTIRLSDKLDHKKLRPFKIKKKISEVNYELILPNTIKIHLVFYIALLEYTLYDPDELDYMIVSTNELEYEVEKIVDHK